MSDSFTLQLLSALGAAFTMERELGGGGMSRVFVVRDAGLGREIVVKVLSPDFAQGMSVERFQREIMLAAMLQEPHIVPLLSAGRTADGMPFYTMPFVRGDSLRERLAAGRLPAATATGILRDVARALVYAHDAGIVHRDIKPENVLLSSGTAVVTDFGIAKALSASTMRRPDSTLTQAGASIGTPAYMSPEQAAGDEIDARTDVYAFGILAYEVLAGAHPFGSGRSAQQMLVAHIADPVLPLQQHAPALPAALLSLVMRCVEKDPDRRPQTSREILDALEQLPVSTDERRVSASGPRRIARFVLPAIVVVVTAAIGATVWRQTRESPAVPPSAASDVRSIAVMPLENAGADTAMQYFAEGMTDELTRSVANVGGVRVASRSATQSAWSKSAGDVRAMGQRLGVNAVLEGRLRRNGPRMRLSATLTSVGDGLILWNATYDREVRDAFQIQDEVAEAIARALRVHLAGLQGPPDSSGHDSVVRARAYVEANDLYLRANFLREKYNEADLRKSLVLFAAAIEKDPTYAAPWGGIAAAWGMLADDYVAPREAVPRFRDAIAHGLAIDSTVPGLQFSRGVLTFLYDRNARAAEREFARAIRGPAVKESATLFYPSVLWAIGLRDSAASYLRHTIESDPGSPTALRHATAYFAQIGDTATAIQYCTRTIELVDDGCMARLRPSGPTQVELQGLAAQRAHPDRMVSLGARFTYAFGLIAAQRVDDARRELIEIERLADDPRRYVREDRIGILWALLGDNSRALRWYERAATSGSSGIGSFYIDLATSPLRHDPRALAFARRVGLPDPPVYWR